MEKGTVTLSLEKYNELRDFKQKIEEGKTYVKGKTYVIQTGMWNTKTFITTDEAIKSIAETNKELGEEIVRLKNISHELRKMSYWEFRKWRKSQI